ncbi:MAG: aminopeptidase [bacterium]
MYIPDKTILKRYADVVIKFALNDCKGIKKGDIVYVRMPESAKPILPHLQRSILEAGGNMILDYLPDGIEREFYELADDDQLIFYPKRYSKALIDSVDHVVRVLSEYDPKELDTINPHKLMQRQSKAGGVFRNLMQDKEKKGKLTWNIFLYPTEAMAHEANMTLEEYWKEIIQACYLNEEDPIQKWKEVTEIVEKQKAFLSNLNIEYLEIKGDQVDLRVKIGSNRSWQGGGGRNIPSFEIFTSPDNSEAEGYIKFSEPLFIYSNLVEDVELWFKDGKVIKSKASKGESLLKKMISTKGANRLGEISLTDKKLSRIHKFMAETLYDENAGGTYGNMHLALGQAFFECLKGDFSKTSKQEFTKLGFNNSKVHTDIVTRLNRTVTAILKDNKTVVIYKDGEFQI